VTSPQTPTMSSDDAGFKAALAEARQGSHEGGVPIGAALVSAQGKVLGQGHNMRVQKGSATLHVCEKHSLVHNACVRAY
jgi:tRNA(Arg) A34 adenosine deaminase TadA